MSGIYGGRRARELEAEREQAAAEGRPYAVPVECALACHDTTFECIARSFEAVSLPGSMAEALRSAADDWD